MALVFLRDYREKEARQSEELARQEAAAQAQFFLCEPPRKSL